MSEDLKNFINANFKDPLVIKMTDDKENKWEIDAFYIFENQQPLCSLEEPQKIIQDYVKE